MTRIRIKIIYFLYYTFLPSFSLRFSLPSRVFVLFFFHLFLPIAFSLPSFLYSEQNDLTKTTNFCTCLLNTNHLTRSMELLRTTDRCEVSYLSPRWAWWHDSTCALLWHLANECFIFLSVFRCNEDNDYARCQTGHTVCRYMWCSLRAHLATDWGEVIGIGEEVLVNVSASRNNKTKQLAWLNYELWCRVSIAKLLVF